MFNLKKNYLTLCTFTIFILIGLSIVLSVITSDHKHRERRVMLHVSNKLMIPKMVSARYVVSIDPGCKNMGVVVYNTNTKKIEIAERVNLNTNDRKRMTRFAMGDSLLNWLNHNIYVNSNTICLTENQMGKAFIYLNGVLKGYFKERLFMVSPKGRNNFFQIKSSHYQERKKKSIEIANETSDFSVIKGKCDDVTDAYLQLKFWLSKTNFN